MAVEIINYTKNRNAGGKFVVLVEGGDAESGLVLFSDFSRDSQHAHIVRRWERDAGKTMAAAGYRTAGGGWWKLLGGGALKLFGGSAAYGAFNPGWLRKNLPVGSAFGENTVLIDAE